MPRTFKIPKFDPETGSGTLSSISSKFGVSQDDILKANKNNVSAIPDFNNPDRIIAGATLNIPDRDQVQQSTTEQRRETERRINKVDEMSERKRLSDDDRQRRLEEIQAGLDNVKESALELKEKRDSEAQQQQQDGGEEQGLIGRAGTEQINQIQQNAQSEIDQVNSRLDSIKSLTDTSYSALIESTKQIYQGRIDQMKESNRRAFASKEQVGLRTGRSRYLPVVQAGILTGEELDGHARISELEGEMLSAIAEIQQARAENKLNVFNQRMDELERIETNMQEEIQNVYDRAVEQQNLILKQKKEERERIEFEFQQSLDTVESVAPAVTSALQDFDSEEQQVEFLQEYANLKGVPFDILMGAVQEQLSEEEAERLQNEARRVGIQSTISTIQKRGQDITATSRERQMRSRIVETFEQNKDDNGKVPATVWQKARQAWVTAQLPGNQFTKEFEGYKPSDDEEDII